MADRRHSDESHPNAGDSSGPESLVSQAELLRPEEIPGLAPPPLRDSGGIRLFAALKNVRGHERSYQIRRAGVISLGFSIVVALLATISWVKSLVIESYADTGKLFSGPFEIYVEANSAYSFLPGGSPVLRATCVPATVGSESGATEKRVTILETTLLEPDRLREFYAEYVSRQVAFVFFDTIFAITTNGGHSWETATLHGGPGDSAGFGGSGLVVHIDGVMIDETGHGFLFASGVENLDSAWVTEDFGITWLPPSF